MKTQYTQLSDMARELERRMASKQDFVASTSNVTMTEAGELEWKNGESHVLPATEIAHGQIAERVNIPAKYYNRMKAQSPELLARNVNHWFKKEPENRMIRTLDGNVRAFLSDRYARIENEEIANVVLPILLEHEGVKIMSSAITETRMYIKAVFTKIEGEVRKGDVVQAGIAISNSEVGLGAVRVEPFAYRLVCTNGMVMPDSRFSARHLGARFNVKDGVEEMLTDETKKADDKAVLLTVRDVVRGSFNEVSFQRQLALMQGATEDKLQGNPTEAIKLLAKKNSLSDFEQGSVLRNLIEGADLSRWGVANAVTATAKEDMLSYDRAHELETLGGRIVEGISRIEWQELALAA